jgi:hypothetical protein
LAGLIIYVSVIAINGVLFPEQVMKGIIIKLIILLGFIRAIKAAHEISKLE